MASSLELNKLVAGVLAAGIIASLSGVVAGILYYPETLEENAFSIDTGDSDVAEAGADDESAPEAPLAVRLASADPAAGEAITRQCTACHVFDEGGEDRVGPHLWDIVGRDIGGSEGFNYSDALAGMEDVWSYENLYGFLAAPRDWAPGTSMSYAGLRDGDDRVNLLAYLQTLSNDPVAFPVAEEAPAEAADAADDTAEEAEEQAAADDTSAAEEAVEDVADAAEEVAETTEEAVTETAEAVAETTEEAADAATATATAAAEVAADTADEATEATTEVAEAATEDAATEVAEAATDDAAGTDAAGDASPIVAMVAAADPADGERLFRQCAACHVPEQGGPNRVGPGLWGVFGADIASHEGFNYSDALQAIEGNWTVDKLDGYLANPREFAPGNRMAFAGLRSEDDRAAMIAYLHSLAEAPQPLQ